MSKANASLDNFDPEFNHAAPIAAPAPAPGQPVRNLTQEALEGFFKQKVAEAKLAENPPKELLKLDPAKRAAEMCSNG